MQMRTRFANAAAAAALALACTLAAAGCGNITTPDTGSAGGASSGAATGGVLDNGAQYASVYKANGTATVTAGQPLAMTMGTMSFSPNTLTVQKGTTVTLQIKNTSALDHNISLDPFHVNQDVKAGQSATVTFTPDQTGTFYFYCNVAGHAGAGMVGKITVQ